MQILHKVTMTSKTIGMTMKAKQKNDIAVTDHLTGIFPGHLPLCLPFPCLTCHMATISQHLTLKVTMVAQQSASTRDDSRSPYSDFPGDLSAPC